MLPLAEEWLEKQKMTFQRYLNHIIYEKSFPYELLQPQRHFFIINAAFFLIITLDKCMKNLGQHTLHVLWVKTKHMAISKTNFLKLKIYHMKNQS